MTVTPRGIKKEKLQIDLWGKQIAPTNDLRKEFGHDPEKFSWFKSNYKKEIIDNDMTEDFVKQVNDWLKEGNVTLIYSARDKEHNQAIVLQDYLLQHVKMNKRNQKRE